MLSTGCPFCRKCTASVTYNGDTAHYTVRCGWCGSQGPKGRTPEEAEMWWEDRQTTEINIAAYGYRKGTEIADFHLNRAQHFHAALKQIARTSPDGEIKAIATLALEERFQKKAL